jgi:YteA family regulatory protein
LNSETLTKFKHRLEREKKRLQLQISKIESSGLGEAMQGSLGELSVYDNHPADIGDELFERSKDIALRDNENILLEDVKTALNKIHNHSYGVCDKCGQEIASERLEAIPWASQCLKCQQETESTDITAPRPIEEDLLSPPFERSFLDSDSRDFVGFDGEDSLQSVLRYGSSDSPQDIPGAKNYKKLFPNSDEHQGLVEWTDVIPAVDSRQDEKTKKAER